MIANRDMLAKYIEESLKGLKYERVDDIVKKSDKLMGFMLHWGVQSMDSMKEQRCVYNLWTPVASEYLETPLITTLGDQFHIMTLQAGQVFVEGLNARVDWDLYPPKLHDMYLKRYEKLLPVYKR